MTRRLARPGPPALPALPVGRRALLAATLLAGCTGVAAAQPRHPPIFLEFQPAEGGGTVAIAVAQAVRIGRLGNQTVIDTATFVQLQTREPLDSVVRRLAASGLALIALTDLAGTRTYVAIDRIVSVRRSDERHASGARTSIIVDGLRFSRDMGVREGLEEVMAAIERAARQRGEAGPG